MADNFTRRKILSRPTYWLTKARLDFTRILHEYMTANNLKRKELAEKLDCSPAYVSQMLNGDTNVSLSKLFKVAFTIGKVPFIRYEDIDDVVIRDIIMYEDSYETENMELDSVHKIHKEAARHFSVIESIVNEPVSL